MDVIALCTEKVPFNFEGIAFKQTGGVVVGSPLDPTLRDVSLGMVEQKVLSNTLKFSLYKRYSTVS